MKHLRLSAGVLQQQRNLRSAGVLTQRRRAGFERGDSRFERGLNSLGRLYYNTSRPFNFSEHHELKTTYTASHSEQSQEARITGHPNAAIHDKYSKWFTVEGLPGSGKGDFAAGLSEAAGLKNFGKGHLWWELERLKFKGEVQHYNDAKYLVDKGWHWMNMREVDLEKFFKDPNDDIHTCRVGHHMLSQQHIHSMDALRHLLSEAQGVCTVRSYHSDYCFAYAMMKMGYMSKNYYEMVYTVRQATADGSNTACDLTQNVSYMISMSPEESFEKIKERGNEAEISTCNLEFLKYVDEAYQTFWREDMNNKGCTVIDVTEKTADGAPNVEYEVDRLSQASEEDIRHPLSRWAFGWNAQYTMSGGGIQGPKQQWRDWMLPPSFNRPRRSDAYFWRYFTSGMNKYEMALNLNLHRGPMYSYEVLYSYQPWDELAESWSCLEAIKWQNGPCTDEPFHGDPENDIPAALRYHPHWKPASADWHKTGHAPLWKILFGGKYPYFGNEFIQTRQHMKIN